MMERSKYLSIIVPVYNEEENILLLHASISHALKEQTFSYEVIYVDDGSTDGTFPRLNQIALSDQNVRVIRLRRNFGQTAAISAGVAHSTGEILMFMDGDLQNDPVDIPRLLAKLEEGYDIVSGWRKKRKDAQLSRKIPSWLANRLISKVTNVYLHDYGCTLKAYRRGGVEQIRLFWGVDRFLSSHARRGRAAISEVEVTHHPTRFWRCDDW